MTRPTCAYVPVLWLLLSFTAFAQSTKPAVPTDGYKVVDLMPAFWEFRAKATKLPVPDQGKVFQKMLVERYPDVYTRGVLSFNDDMPFSAQIQKRYVLWQELIAPRLPLMRKLSGQLAAELPGYEASFRKAFPDLSYRGAVYFLASLGGFDGATRKVNGKTALLFGIDMIAFVYGEKADLQPFFHHELFHIYHSQFLDGRDEEPLYLPLWREGLAVYIARTLNPAASDVVLFGLPPDLPARAQAMLPQLARELRTKMDSTSREDYARFFFGQSKSTDLPARSGYYVGYLIAQKIGKGRSLQALAKIKEPELRAQIERTLTELAAGK